MKGRIEKIGFKILSAMSALFWFLFSSYTFEKQKSIGQNSCTIEREKICMQRQQPYEQGMTGIFYLNTSTSKIRRWFEDRRKLRQHPILCADDWLLSACLFLTLLRSHHQLPRYQTMGGNCFSRSILIFMGWLRSMNITYYEN